jgi:hypothetical protein
VCSARIHTDAKALCEITAAIPLRQGKEHIAFATGQRRDLMSAETSNEQLIECARVATFGQGKSDGRWKRQCAGDRNKGLEVTEEPRTDIDDLFSIPNGSERTTFRGCPIDGRD